MLSFLFWNLMGEQRPARDETLRAHLGRIANALDVDVFLFAEPFCQAGELARLLSKGHHGRYREFPSVTGRIQIFSRLPRATLINHFDSEDGRMTIRRVQLRDRDILLIVMHFHSLLYRSPAEQSLKATVIREEIVTAEETVGHHRTVLIGDLNMNPYDHGITGRKR